MVIFIPCRLSTLKLLVNACIPAAAAKRLLGRQLPAVPDGRHVYRVDFACGLSWWIPAQAAEVIKR